MEIGLKFEEMAWMDECAAMPVTREEALETAIPEYCPDITRIVESTGQICLRERRLSEGQLTVNGAVKVRVLYTSEESAGLRGVTLSVPFSCQIDDKRLAGCRTVCVHSRLLLCEVKPITSRKVYVRVMPEVTVTGYQPRQCRLCTQADGGIQTRWEDWTAEMLSEVSEREFSYTQEAMLDGTQPTPEELLADGMHLRVSECRHIGSKLVVKGEATVSALYRAEGQQLCSYETILPFSQILDGMGQSEDAMYDVYPQLQESELRVMRTEGGSGFGVTARIVLLIFVREKRKMRYIADLYSTVGETETQTVLLQPTTNYRRECLRQDVVQKLEFGHTSPFFYVTQVDCAQVSAGAAEGKTELRSNVHMKVLYLDESGSPMCTERTSEVTALTGAVPESCWAACGQPVQHITGGSCEISLPIELVFSDCRRKELTAITKASVPENSGAEPMPSVVMRRMEPGETLWDIAKQYRTDQEFIRSVNELTEETTDRMLLIPKAQ